MGLYEIAAWATIGSFLAAVIGIALKVWRIRQGKRRPRK